MSKFKVGDHVYILQEKERCFNVEPTVYIITDVIPEFINKHPLCTLKPIDSAFRNEPFTMNTCFGYQIAHVNMCNKIASNLLRKREICTLELSIGKHHNQSR